MVDCLGIPHAMPVMQARHVIWIYCFLNVYFERQVYTLTLNLVPDNILCILYLKILSVN